MNPSSSRTLLVISPWESMWSLSGKAGVSDEFHFIEGFRAAGWDIHFLVPESGEDEGAYRGATRHTYPNFFRPTSSWPVAARRLLWQPLFNLVVTRRALALARELQPRFVLGLSHYSSYATWRCRHRGFRAGVKLFGVMDLVHTEWTRARYAFKNFEQLVALRFSQDAWIVLDDGTRGGDILRECGVDAKRIHFLPNGVNLEWLRRTRDRTGARQRLDIPPNARVVLFLARLVASKRPADIIRAMPEIMALAGNHAHLVIAGDGELADECRRVAAACGVTQHVRFTGVVSHADVPTWMDASDVFVTTSNLTNMALPTCEALICGVPVVAYDVGDTSRLVRTGETGTCVRDGDIRALAGAVAALLGDEPLRARMSVRAQEIAAELLTGWDERVGMEIEIIERATGARD